MELDLGHILSILINKIKVLIAAVIAFALAALLITEVFITPLYQSTGTLYVYNTSDRGNSSETITSSDITTSQKLVDTYIVIMQSNTVLEKVAQDCGLDYTPAEIKEMFSASAESNTEVCRVTITNANPAEAQRICNSFLKVAPDEIIRVVKAGSVEVIDTASLPATPSSPNLKMNILLGAILGFLISAVVVLLRELLNTRIRSDEDVTKLTGVPILGIIPTIHVSGSGKRGNA